MGRNLKLSVISVDEPGTYVNSHANNVVMIKKPKAVMMREPMT